MHIYHLTSGAPVATVLRPAPTPKGTEVRTVIKHVMNRLRQHWLGTRIVWRGDCHYGRVGAMEWAHAKSSQTKPRTFVSFTYRAGSWKRPRKVAARLECSLQPDAGDATSCPNVPATSRTPTSA